MAIDVSNRPKTLVHHIAYWAEQQASTPAIHGKVDGRWQQMTWAEYWTAVRETAKGFIAMGHEVGDCVAIVGDNRMEWVVSQFGIMAARGVPAPIYTTNTTSQVAHILRNCEAKIAVGDTSAQLAKYGEAMKEDGVHIEQLVSMLSGQDGDAKTLDEVRALGREQDDAELEKRLGELTDDEVALLIYTSGTTGVAKGVMLDHGGMLAIAMSVMDMFPVIAEPTTYRAVSYLPLCHVAEQLFTNLGHLGSGGQVYFCGDLKEILEYLVHARPTIFLGVPRVWEKFQAKLEAGLNAATGIKALLAGWARKTELAAQKKAMATGQPVESFFRRLANKLVISKVQAKLGLDQVRVAVTGAAPISIGTLEFFASLGIIVHEGYGMSETTGVATANPLGGARFGTVGEPLSCVQVRIADDDEILLKGRNMTRGYLRMPDKTAELIDDEGWLHTGDLGAMIDGRLKITGRKKDILITAGGKNVAPAEMEAHIQQIPGVGQVVVVGDAQPYLCALITLDGEGLDALRSAAGVSGDTVAELAGLDAVKRFIDAEIQAGCNAKVARYQTIKKITVLPAEFSVDGGELTPTMKIKRNVVANKYAAEIEAFYA